MPGLPDPFPAVSYFAAGIEGVRRSPRAMFRDNFNRTAADLNGNNGWAVTSPGGAVSISGSEALANANTASGSWLVQTPGAALSNANQFSEVTVVSGLSGDLFGVLCRFTDSNNFYVGRYEDVGATHEYQIYKRVTSTYTKIASLAEAFPTEPFRIRLEVFATELRLRAFINRKWITKCAVTDTAHATGSPGFYMQQVAGNYTCDDAALGNL